MAVLERNGCKFSVANMEGSYYIDEENTLHIFVRGSGMPWWRIKDNDWVRTNFNFFPIRGIHRGFLIGALRIANELQNLGVSTWSASKIKVYGMSLGGAVAEVLGVFFGWKEEDRIPVKAYNFGGPRPWKKRVASYVKYYADVEAYRYGQDIVSILPNPIFWEHAGTRYRIKAPKGFRPFRDHNWKNYREWFEYVFEND